jgi:hypothetical protein
MAMTNGEIDQEHDPRGNGEASRRTVQATAPRVGPYAVTTTPDQARQGHSCRVCREVRRSYPGPGDGCWPGDARPVMGGVAVNSERLSCPSAQPDMERARIFGVLSGSTEAPRVAYLKSSAAVDAQTLHRLGPLKPTEVFRYAATCEERRCSHFDGARCTLASRIVRLLDPVTTVLPPCTIRPTCRWHAEEGRAACFRCPQLVTSNAEVGDALRKAATPPELGQERPADDPA